MNKSGTIYGIKCTENQMIYVGATINTAKLRWSAHRLAAKRGDNGCGGEFYSDIRKYGEEAFEIIVLKEDINSKEELIIQENFYINNFRALKLVYNPRSSTGLGDKRSDEARANMRKSAIDRKSPSPVSDTTRAKLSVVMKGNQNTLNMRHSSEAKAKISAARKAYWAKKRDAKNAGELV